MFGRPNRERKVKIAGAEASSIGSTTAPPLPTLTNFFDWTRGSGLTSLPGADALVPGLSGSPGGKEGEPGSLRALSSTDRTA